MGLDSPGVKTCLLRLIEKCNTSSKQENLIAQQVSLHKEKNGYSKKTPLQLLIQSNKSVNYVQ